MALHSQHDPLGDSENGCLFRRDGAPELPPVHGIAEEWSKTEVGEVVEAKNTCAQRGDEGSAKPPWLGPRSGVHTHVP